MCVGKVKSMWCILAVGVIVKPSFLSVQLLPSKQTFTQSWVRTPLVDLHADADSPRFCVSVADRAFWFYLHLHPDVIRYAHTVDALEEAAMEVELSPTQACGLITVSRDVAKALWVLDCHGLEHQLCSQCLALDVDRVKTDRKVVQALACFAKQRALRRLGA